MKNIKLSICIATFNRAAFIGETLESIISQATDEVEIVIVDGGSSDNTGEVVRRYRQEFPRLRYFRQETNQGVDRDYARTVELARGEYCWFMSDDDILKPGAVRAVLEAAQKGYGLIIVNAEDRSFDLLKLLNARRLPLPADRVYGPEDNELLFTETANHISFIPCVVIKRTLWNQREKERYFGTAFAHVGVIFQEPLAENTLAIATPLISIRHGNASWTARSFEIWLFKWPSLIWSFPDYSKSAKEKVTLREPWRKVTVLLSYRARGAYSLEEYRSWIEPRSVSLRQRIAAYLIAVSPGCLVNLLGVIYCAVCYRKSRLPLADIVDSPFYFVNYVRKLFV